MAETGGNLGLVHTWGYGFDGWNTENNTNLKLLDGLTQCVVQSLTTTAQPASPVNGDAYALPSSGCTGTDWAGEDGNIAIYAVDSWVFITPKTGWSCRLESTQVNYVYDGSNWSEESFGNTFTTTAGDPFSVSGDGSASIDSTVSVNIGTISGSDDINIGNSGSDIDIVGDDILISAAAGGVATMRASSTNYLTFSDADDSGDLSVDGDLDLVLDDDLESGAGTEIGDAGERADECTVHTAQRCGARTKPWCGCPFSPYSPGEPWRS